MEYSTKNVIGFEMNYFFALDNYCFALNLWTIIRNVIENSSMN